MDLRAETSEIGASAQSGEDPAWAAPARPGPRDGWPAEGEPQRPAAGEQRPFQDIPSWIWRLFFASWFTLFATFAMIFAVSSQVVFILAVVATFALVFFLTPLVLLRMTRRARFKNLRRQVDVSGGRCSDVEAATQIVLLPIALTLGLLAIGWFVPR